MTGGSGVIIRRPSVAESLRILLGEADCDGALGVVEMALPLVSPGRRCTCIPRTRRPSTCSPVNCPCKLARRSLPVAWHMGMRAQGRTPHAGKLWNRRRATPLHVCTRWFRATLRADACQAARLRQCWRNCREAERATRLIGPALVSPAQPSRPDAPEFSWGAS
jgi:hypothetical protein